MWTWVSGEDQIHRNMFNRPFRPYLEMASVAVCILSSVYLLSGLFTSCSQWFNSTVLRSNWIICCRFGWLKLTETAQLKKRKSIYLWRSNVNAVPYKGDQKHHRPKQEQPAHNPHWQRHTMLDILSHTKPCYWLMHTCITLCRCSLSSSSVASVCLHGWDPEAALASADREALV